MIRWTEKCARIKSKTFPMLWPSPLFSSRARFSMDDLPFRISRLYDITISNSLYRDLEIFTWKRRWENEFVISEPLGADEQIVLNSLSLSNSTWNEVFAGWLKWLRGVGNYSNGVGGSISLYVFLYEIRILSAKVWVANSHHAQFFADISSKPKSTPPNFSVWDSLFSLSLLAQNTSKPHLIN